MLLATILHAVSSRSGMSRKCVAMTISMTSFVSISIAKTTRGGVGVTRRTLSFAGDEYGLREAGERGGERERRPASGGEAEMAESALYEGGEELTSELTSELGGVCNMSGETASPSSASSCSSLKRRRFVIPA